MQAGAEHVLSGFEAVADLALSEYLRSPLRVAHALGLRDLGEREQNQSAAQDAIQLHPAFLPSCEPPALASITSRLGRPGSFKACTIFGFCLKSKVIANSTVCCRQERLSRARDEEKIATAHTLRRRVRHADSSPDRWFRQRESSNGVCGVAR